MKRSFLTLCTALIMGFCVAQESNSNNEKYNLFSCKNAKNKYFVMTSSGVSNTPIGFKVGFLCNTGAYIGSRFGKGEVEALTTEDTNLFSITAGLIRPVYVGKTTAIHMFAGAGYGQWWKSRRDHWTKEGYEIEAGLMISIHRFMFNIGGNVLNGNKTYATYDLTVGIGYRF